MEKIHFKKAISKANYGIFLKWKPVISMLYLLLVVIICLPFKINDFLTIEIKFWMTAMIMLINFKLIWSKIFFHRLSKKWLYIPHEVVGNIPFIIFVLLGYGIINHHDWSIYVTIGILTFIYILLNIPLYLRLKKRGDGKSIWVRNLYAIATGFFNASPIFITTGLYALWLLFDFSFWISWPATSIYLVLTFLMIYGSHLKYYFLTKRFIWVFVPNQTKHNQVLLNL